MAYTLLHMMPVLMGKLLTVLSLLLAAAGFSPAAFALPSADIVFVTQVPIPYDFATINSVFGNHQPGVQEAGRGGDLYIRYGDGTLRNLTAAAGFGNAGFQGEGSIQVRDPSVHWDGKKVLFSMLIGAPRFRYDYNINPVWQLYEITGLAKNEVPQIKKVQNQPSGYNNVMAVYSPDDQIIFASDRPRDGARHLYPQLDEYESTPTNTGLWRLNSATGELKLLDHSPSGDFHPIIDSFGRVIFTRWDHLQRDQQNDAGNYGAFNFKDESSAAVVTNQAGEVYPEPRAANDPGRKTHEELHTINHFFPWQVNPDGTDLETLNHIGRHELHEYFNRAFNDDDNLEEFYTGENARRITNFLHIRESPVTPGLYYGIDAPEFSTHAAGQIVSITGAPHLNADQMTVSYITHRDTSGYTDTPGPNHSGMYRNPLPLSDGTLVASHASTTRAEYQSFSRTSPVSRYDFRLKMVVQSGAYFQAGTALTPGITRAVSFYDPDELVTYNNVTMWELQPAELKARQRPVPAGSFLPQPEAQVFSEMGIDPASLRSYLAENNLAVVISRDVTTRDAADRQQPFNLKVPGSVTSTTGGAGRVYNVSGMQFFQGDLIRGYFGYGGGAIQDGRRVLARIMHDPSVTNPPDAAAPAGGVKIASDGSMAAFVPAGRAMTWQMTDPQGRAVVRERYWLTFQPGEIRVCASCHGVNTTDQAGRNAPRNPPEALRELLSHWKNIPYDPPRFSLSMLDARKARRVSKLKSGQAFRLKVSGSNAKAAGKFLRLELSVNGNACPQPLAGVTSGADGNLMLRGRAASASGKLKLRFDLIYNGLSVSSVNSKFQGASSHRKARAGEVRRFCKKMASKVR